MAHTKGPWIAVGYQVEVPSDKIPDICTCNPSAMDMEHLKWNEKTVLANARLIAAAPDLLNALKMAENYIRHRNFMTDEQEADVLSEIKYAIDKAKRG